MSQIKMMKPADGVEGVKAVIDVAKTPPNPCPPVILGVGISGTMEKAALLAKEALLGKSVLRMRSKCQAGEELLEKVNNLGIGPQGLGGRILPWLYTSKHTLPI